MAEPSDPLVQRLNRLHPKLIDLSLGRIERLLARLDYPQRALPATIHVAGTNGKGSTIAFLRAMAEAARLKVQVYSSPHLVRFNERIRLGNGIIENEALEALLDECEAANGEAPITFFEITTALALLAFSREPADLVLLETGLGGKNDATNVISHPLAAVLTPISRDHENFLGSEIAGITSEKAAIMKPGALCISAIQPPAASPIIADYAKQLGAELHLEDRDFRTRPGPDGMTYDWGGGQMHLPTPALDGAHQIQNAGLALATLRALPALKVDEKAQARGLITAAWPARLQRLSKGPLARQLPDGWELWLDGGHNAAAGEALAAQAGSWADKPVFCIFAILTSKDPKAFLSPLAPHLAGLKAVPIPDEEAGSPAPAAAEAAAELGIKADTCDIVSQAVQEIIGTSERPGRILICGSLYLAGHVLAENG